MKLSLPEASNILQTDFRKTHPGGPLTMPLGLQGSCPEDISKSHWHDDVARCRRAGCTDQAAAVGVRQAYLDLVAFDRR